MSENPLGTATNRNLMDSTETKNGIKEDLSKNPSLEDL
jgi:hypothetical protein